MTMKNNVNIEKYHLTKRDLGVVYLCYKKWMSGPKIARKLGITYGQVKYCLKKFNVKQYIWDVVMPDIERQKIRIIEDGKLKMAKWIQQLMEDLESNDPKRKKKALKELARIYGRTNKPPKPMSDEELKRGIDETVKRFGINDIEHSRKTGEKCGFSANMLPDEDRREGEKYYESK